MRLKVKGDAKFKLHWVWNDTEGWTTDAKKAIHGRSYYYKTLHVPGDWQVHVLDENDTILKTLEFTVEDTPKQ